MKIDEKYGQVKLGEISASPTIENVAPDYPDFFPKLSFQTETRWYMFKAAKLFGKRLADNMYEWRGKIWVTGEVKNPYGGDL